MPHFLLNSLAWSVLLSQISMTVYAETFAAEDPQNFQQLATLVLTAENQNEKDPSAQIMTQFKHDLLDMPFSQSHLSQAEIQKYNIQRIHDALSRVSGVFYQDSYGGGGWDNYSFRGFSTDPNMGTTNLRNGLSGILGIHLPRDMVNIQAIDFMKGPMAAMYGQGAIGGMMNITTKQPEWQAQHQVNFNLATQDQYRAAVDSTAAINQQLAYRLGLSYENNQSFRDKVNHQHFFIAPQLAWKISDRTQLNFDSDVGQYDYVFDRGIPMSDDGHFLSNKHAFFGEPKDGKVTVKEQMYQLRLTHKLDENWNTITAFTYAQGQRAGISTEIGSLQADVANRFRRYRKFDTNTTQVQSMLRGKMNTAHFRHELVGNIEASHYGIDQIQYRNASGSNMPMHLSSPLYGNILPLTRLSKKSTETQNNLAFNVQDQIFWNDQWSLLFGGRLDHMQQKMTDHKANVTQQKRSIPFSPRVAIHYRPSSALSFYSQWGKAFEMNTGLKESNFTLFEPEKTDSWEIGTKYQYAAQNWFGFSYFNMHKEHLLTEGVFDDYVDNGQVKSQGIELNWQHQLFDAVLLSANYSYTNAQVVKSEADQAGARLKNIPKHAANLSGDYRFYLCGHDAGLTTNLNYFSERSANYKDNGTRLPSFHILNVGADIQLNTQLKAQLNIQNLFNRDYYVASYTHYWIMPGEPIKATLSLSFNF